MDGWIGVRTHGKRAIEEPPPVHSSSLANAMTSIHPSQPLRVFFVWSTYLAVPRISLTVPESSRAMERDRMERAMEMMSSSVRFPLCLMFFSWGSGRKGSETCRQ